MAQPELRLGNPFEAEVQKTVCTEIRDGPESNAEFMELLQLARDGAVSVEQARRLFREYVVGGYAA